MGYGKIKKNGHIMKTRRQFLGLLAGLPLVGRLMQQEQIKPIADEVPVAMEIPAGSDTTSYYIWWNGNGEYWYTDSEGNLLDASYTL